MPTLSAPSAPSVSINNTGFLFFVLVGAFLVFVTVRGDLPKWLGLLGLGGSPKKAATTGAAPASGGVGSALPSLPSTGSTSLPNFLGGASSDASNQNAWEASAFDSASPNPTDENGFLAKLSGAASTFSGATGGGSGSGASYSDLAEFAEFA